ncbi:MAG: twin-arginine translocase TatA/TatE family subunit [Desulfurivibrionaceae bacterium]
MFGIGLPELILIMAVALIVVGPKKLPELARGLAKQLVELKKAANVLKDSLQEEELEQNSLDHDLPVGFSRPEELAAAGRKAAGIESGDQGEASEPAEPAEPAEANPASPDDRSGREPVEQAGDGAAGEEK